MENTKLLIGMHCMERPEIVISLRPHYTLLTTDLVVAESQCIYPASIQCIKFSPNEMLQLHSVFSENENLQKLGFVESSLLFVAVRQRIMVAVTDRLTERACKEIGIDMFKIEGHITNPHQLGESYRDLRTTWMTSQVNCRI